MKAKDFGNGLKGVLLTGLLSLAMIGPVQAGTAFTFGYGNKNCEFFLQAESRGDLDKEYLLLVSWIQGYMSSYSMVDSLTQTHPVDVLDNISINSVIGWVHDTCASDSRIYVGNAMANLIIKLLKAEHANGN